MILLIVGAAFAALIGGVSIWRVPMTPEYLCLTGDADTKLQVIGYLDRKERWRARRLLRGLLRDEDAEVRRNAAICVARMELTGLSDRIEAMAQEDGDLMVRAQAIESLATLAPERATPLVERALAAEEREMRIAGVIAAGARLPVPEATWLRLLHDPAPTVREAALHAAADRRLTAAVPVLARDLESQDLFELSQTHEALIRITQENLGILPGPWLKWAEEHGESNAATDREAHK